MTTKVDSVIDRLIAKIKLSQTPVPGFVIGLSGTDSVLAMHICYHALREYGLEESLHAFHFMGPSGKSAFSRHTVPWIKENYKIQMNLFPTFSNTDPYRWAELHTQAKKLGVWTVGTINATEYYLGNYSMLHTAVSVMPIRNIWKSEVMEGLKDINVPEELLESARIPDCMCGRDEFAAENIQLIDNVIRYNWSPDTDPEKLRMAVDYIKNAKAEGGFRARVPYVP